MGAQAVEIELDTRDFSYKVLKAAAVLDAGRVINPKAARGVFMGGMSMGLSLACMEGFIFDDNGVVLNPKLITFGEGSEYIVDFLA